MPIGTNPLGQWLSYYFWAGDVALEPYTEAVIKYLCPRDWEPFVNVTISWDKPKPKVSITSIVPMFADCRSRQWKREREALQGALNQIIKRSTSIEKIIERAAYRVAFHEKCLVKAKELRDAAKDARLDVDAYTPDIDLHLDQYASELEAEADRLLQRYLEIVNELLVLAPPKQRSSFRADVIRRAEQLAKDKRWLEEYQVKLESA